MGENTTFLFANPSFLEGASRVLDMGGTLQQYNSSLNSDQADSIAMQRDFAAVNEDMKNAGVIARVEAKASKNNG